ncbi:MAG: hypothetical protein ABIL25_10560 [candidate division WOR-3 bacterium]
MKDPTRRISRWTAKFTPTRQAETLAVIYEDMAKRYAAATVALCSMESQVKQVLDQANVHTNWYVSYLDYARQLFRLSHQMEVSGSSLALAAQVLLDRWVARGLDANVLATIRQEVFNIGPATT